MPFILEWSLRMSQGMGLWGLPISGCSKGRSGEVLALILFVVRIEYPSVIWDELWFFRFGKPNP